jgi:hypothetical protein
MNRSEGCPVDRVARGTKRSRVTLATGFCLAFLALAAGCGASHGPSPAASSHSPDPAASSHNPGPAASSPANSGSPSGGVPAASTTSTPADEASALPDRIATSSRSPFGSGSSGLSEAEQSQDMATIEQDLASSGIAASEASTDLNAAATAQAQNDNP